MSLNEARRQAILRLIERQFEGNAAAFARAIQVQASYLYRMLREPDDPRPKKGIGEEIAQRIEVALDLPPGAIVLAGTPLPDNSDRAQTDDPVMGVAHDLTHAIPLNTPQSVTWEQLMTGAELPREFVLEVRDDSMAGLLVKGNQAIFRTGVEPVSGKPVLARDAAGHLYIRDYVPRTPDHWLAVPRNAAWAPLDSRTDGLTILAVMAGLMWL